MLLPLANLVDYNQIVVRRALTSSCVLPLMDSHISISHTIQSSKFCTADAITFLDGTSGTICKHNNPFPIFFIFVKYPITQGPASRRTLISCNKIMYQYGKLPLCLLCIL